MNIQPDFTNSLKKIAEVDPLFDMSLESHIIPNLEYVSEYLNQKGFSLVLVKTCNIDKINKLNLD